MAQFQLPQCVRINLATWMTAGAVGGEATSTAMLEDRFRHDGSRRISGA
jgi:hypothetical protein